MRRQQDAPRARVAFHELPDWHQDNEFITHGYRPVTPSSKHCAKSGLFSLHNETVNVWSHVVGFFVMALLAYYCFTHHVPSKAGTWHDHLAFVPFYAGAMLCMSASAGFHVFLCHSERRFQLWSKLDYFGIVLVMSGGHATLMTFLFFCEPRLRWLYSGLMTVSSAVVGVLVFRDEFSTPEWRNSRGVAFGTLMCSALFPIAHSYTMEPHSSEEERVLLYVLGMLGVELLGGTIFISRVPERWAPGTFDLVGHSHQIFHCFVVAGIVCFEWGLIVAFEHRHSISCPVP